MEERFKALNKSIWDSIKEEQVKLGYRKEVIRLYYPIESVERMLQLSGAETKTSDRQKQGTQVSVSSMQTHEDTACEESEGGNGGSLVSRNKELQDWLSEFAAAERDTLGDIRISSDGERCCFRLPEEAAEYIHEHTPKTGFLYDFIEVIARHGISIEDVFAVFRKYSNKLHIEKLEEDDFDYLVYFEDGVPDDYRYCLTDEGHHIIYHRFTPEDYAALGA